MEKEILVQYADVKKEVKDLKIRILKIQESLQEIEREGVVTDFVKGGRGGQQKYRIEGFPYPDYNRKKILLYARKANLETLENQLLERVNIVEEFINNLDDSRMRRLLGLRFIDDLSWIQVAHKMGGKHTEEGCRKAVERFFYTK